MHLHAVGAALAHFGNFLALADHRVFLDDDVFRMGICGEEGVVVLDDDHIAVAAQFAAHVHHAAVGRSHDRIAKVAGDVQPLVAHAVEAGNGGAAGGPDEHGLRLLHGRRHIHAWSRRGRGRCAGCKAGGHEKRGAGTENKSVKVLHGSLLERIRCGGFLRVGAPGEPPAAC
jgi:hypothetical protein